jgi:energy-coupling factor transporter ATP-binding protein EcfA2
MKPDPMQDQAIEAKNQQALKTLNRAISFSENQFALIVVRCNYTQLRDRIAYQLQQQSDLDISTLHLPETAKTLYSTIQTAIAPSEGESARYDPKLKISPTETLREQNPKLKTPSCLMLFGLESLVELDEVLTATNLVRNELRKQFSFPIVLWVNDEVLRKLKSLALDLYSWAGMAEIGFEMPTSELVRSLKIHADRLFSSILDLGDESFLANWKLDQPNNLLRQSELKCAIADLNATNFSIQPDLQASLDFLLGQDAHARSEMETAHSLYQRSLNFWLSRIPTATLPPASSQSLLPIPYPERAACLLFYLGWWWRYYAVLQRSIYYDACEQAHDYFRRSLLLFAEENRQDLVARFIIAQAETLQKLKRWDALEEVAKQGLILHKLYKDPVRLARDYGFLAEVSLERADWQLAREQVMTALEVLETVEVELHLDGHPADPHVEQSLTLAHRYHSGWYWFLLARAEKELGNLEAAIYYLETARDRSHPESNPPLYIQILRKLRYYYFAKGDYLLAFRTRQARRLMEHQYGYRAFVGALRLQPQQYQAIAPFPLPPQIDQKLLLAQEISASGRQQDVKQIIDRLNYAKNKLVVIHGNSGVGKSSIVQAGLIPMLMDYAIDGRVTIPIFLDIYTDWQITLEKILVYQQIVDSQPAADPSPSTDLLSRLSFLTDKNLRLPVLIFDQFEEFFFAYETVQSRLPFYRFLRDCLNLPFVKVVLSLREDYLHYLLEFQRLTNLEVIDNDILSKEILYPLGDFTPEDARTVIKNLTRNAQFYLPDDLIDALVKDLAGEVGEVRPIELQVVGAQLQTEGIDTLEKYRQKGPKEKLVQRSLEDVVKDCGTENEELARIILFLLTNEKETRLLKNRDDLEADLIDLGMITRLADLDLVLEVLVGSGLIFLIPDSPADRYQIVHDYLVTFIRNQQIESVISLKTELENERNERKNLEKSVVMLKQQRDQISLDIQSLTQELALTLNLFTNTSNPQDSINPPE